MTIKSTGDCILRVDGKTVAFDVLELELHGATIEISATRRT